MILDRLVLRNFKRFRNAEIEFKDGITGILGNNGTGKSSLVTAIFFALYGVKATGISGDYIVSSFAGPKDKCEVALDFRIGSDEYKIIRTFRKGRSVTHDAELYRNKKLVAKEVSPVEEAVKLAIGMGPTDFRNTIYAAQKDLLTLLDNTPAKRKEWFQKALGIDYLKTEGEKILKEQIDAKTGELQRKEGELAALGSRLSAEDPETLRKSVAVSAAAIAEHTATRDRLAQQKKELEVQQNILREKKAAYDRLLQQQQGLRRERDTDLLEAQKLEAQIALLAGEAEEYHRIEKTAGSYDEVRHRLDTLRRKKEEFLEINAELGFANVQLNDFATRKEKQQALIAGFDTDSARKAGLIEKIRAGLGAGDIAEDRLETAVSYRLAETNRQSGTLAARIENFQKEREKIAADRETIQKAGADGVCPLCRQKLGDHFGSIDAEFSTKIHELEAKAVADLERQERLKKERVAIEALKPELDAVRSITEKLRQKPAYEEELAALTAKHTKKTEEIASLTASLARIAFDDAVFRACEKEAAEVQKVQLRFIELGRKIGHGQMAKEHLAGIRAKIAGRDEELATIAEAITGAAFDPAAAVTLGAAAADADAGLRNAEVAIANATRDKKFAEEKVAAYARAQEEIAGLKKQVTEIGDEIELLKLTRGLIAEYVIYLMQVVRSRLEGEVSRIISEITGGRYEQVLLDEDFNLLVRDIDNDYPIDRFSGGEQDDIAVALRIALSRYLAELHNVHESTFLIFDEIFGSQDEERRNNLLTALRTQESRFPQILLISHIAEMQGEFANTLVIEAGTDGASRVREA